MYGLKRLRKKSTQVAQLTKSMPQGLKRIPHAKKVAVSVSVPAQPALILGSLQRDSSGYRKGERIRWGRGDRKVAP
jgi:hypothetical protein